MTYLIIISLLIILGFLYRFFIFKKYNYDIIKLANGLFTPTVNGRYIFIGVGGEAIYFSQLCGYNTFITKEQAIQYLDKWKSYRAIGAESVGLK